MQPRKCPQCGETIEDDANYSFDENLNLICGDCGKIAFPTDSKSNNEIDSALRQKKGGWGGTSWQDDNYQSGFRNGSGVQGTSRVQGPLGGHIHGLHGGRTQIPGNQTSRHLTCDRFGHVPCDDVDPSQREGVEPFYA